MSCNFSGQILKEMSIIQREQGGTCCILRVGIGWCARPLLSSQHAATASCLLYIRYFFGDTAYTMEVRPRRRNTFMLNSILVEPCACEKVCHLC